MNSRWCPFFPEKGYIAHEDCTDEIHCDVIEKIKVVNGEKKKCDYCPYYKEFLRND